MCFICNFCSKSQPARVPANKIIVKYQQYQHPMRPKAGRRKVEKNGKTKIEHVIDPGGFGLQIAQEAIVCPGCAANWERIQREKQGLLPEGQSAKVIIPLIKPQVKEYTPEPRYQRPDRRPPFRGRPQQNDNQGGNARPPRYQNASPRPYPQRITSPTQPR